MFKSYLVLAYTFFKPYILKYVMISHYIIKKTNNFSWVSFLEY